MRGVFYFNGVKNELQMNSCFFFMMLWDIVPNETTVFAPS